MKNRLLIIFCILLFISKSSIAQHTFNPNPEEIPDEVTKLCDEIAKEGIVMAHSVGKAPRTPPQWKRFEQLEKISSEEVLLKLTNHTNSVVKVYAFWGLINKKSDLLISALKKNEYNTSEVKYHQGCLLYTSVTLIDLVVYKIRKENIKKLSPEDRKYIKRLTKQAKQRSFLLQW
jgi:hypothetical protein